MQNAKDTFYIALRSRLAALNPERTVIVRGAVRPAIVVEENELQQDDPLLDTFVLRWSGATADVTEPLPLLSALCTITFTTRGTPELSGMDRGRVLEALGYELRTLLVPSVTAEQNFAGDAPVTTETNVFWSEPAFGSASESDAALTRVVTVSVFALGEAGAA